MLNSPCVHLKVMNQQITSEEEQKISETQMLVRCCGNSVEANRKLVESTESSMEELDMAAFVQVGCTWHLFQH